jgi:hypothetical protein
MVMVSTVLRISVLMPQMHTICTPQAHGAAVDFLGVFF